MHPRAFFVLALAYLVVTDHGGCEEEEKTSWYTGLRTVLRNCPRESWNTGASEDDFLESFRRCVQEHALLALDSYLTDDVIPVFDGLDLVRYHDARFNSADNSTESDLNDTNWTGIIVRRLLRVLRTHVFKVDVDHFVNNIGPAVNNTQTDVDSNIFEGRRRRHRRRHHHMVPLMMMGFLLIGSILIPMGFQFLAVLGGKALLLAKMALILSSIQGLKKIATNGVNYGLYHAPVGDGWHDRRHVEPSPPLDLPFPLHIRP